MTERVLAVQEYMQLFTALPSTFSPFYLLIQTLRRYLTTALCIRYPPGAS